MRKGELSSAQIDRDWPHQVALHAHVCTMDQFRPMHEFAVGLGAAPRIRTVTKSEPTGYTAPYNLFCFRAREDAQAFIDRFGGWHFDPVSDREKPKGRNVWTWREWGDPAERYPEIVARLEREVGWEPALDADIAMLLGLDQPIRFTIDQEAVEAFLREQLPDGAWEVTAEGGAFDARLRSSPEGSWFHAWDRRINGPGNAATALTLAYLRAIGGRFCRASTAIQTAGEHEEN